MKEEDGWTKVEHLPKEEGRYLVKVTANDYYVYYFDGKKWCYPDVVCWINIPRTELQSPLL